MTIKTSKERIPFQQPANQANPGVGQTIAERRAWTAQGGGGVAPTARPAQRPVDQFSRAGARKTGDLSAFNPRAMYRQAKVRFAGAPYRPDRIDKLERGATPVRTSDATRPNDDQLLKICNIISTNPTYATQKSVWNQAAAKRTAEADSQKAAAASSRAPQAKLARRS